MHDFTSMAEVCFFTNAGPMLPATEQPLRKVDLNNYPMIPSPHMHSDHLIRLINTFGPGAISKPDDVSFGGADKLFLIGEG